MKAFLIFFLILGLALFQTLILPVNFLLVLVIIFSLWKKAPESFIWAFLAGVFLDLFSFGQMGLAAIIFVSLDFLLKLYHQKFSLDHPLMLIFVLLVSYFAFSWLTGKTMMIGEISVLLILILIFRFFQKRLFLALAEGEEGRLKL